MSKIDFALRDLPSEEWLRELDYRISSVRIAMHLEQADIGELWHQVCLHWQTRYSTEDGQEGNDE